MKMEVGQKAVVTQSGHNVPVSTIVTCVWVDSDITDPTHEFTFPDGLVPDFDRGRNGGYRMLPKRYLTIGDRVKPGPDWARSWLGSIGGNESIGTILKVTEYFLRVKWDNGYEDGYPYSGGRVILTKVLDKPAEQSTPDKEPDRPEVTIKIQAHMDPRLNRLGNFIYPNKEDTKMSVASMIRDARDAISEKRAQVVDLNNEISELEQEISDLETHKSKKAAIQAHLTTLYGEDKAKAMAALKRYGIEIDKTI